jgi:hypothetical protein
VAVVIGESKTLEKQMIFRMWDHFSARFESRTVMNQEKVHADERLNCSAI